MRRPLMRWEARALFSGVGEMMGVVGSVRVWRRRMGVFS